MYWLKYFIFAIVGFGVALLTEGFFSEQLPGVLEQVASGSVWWLLFIAVIGRFLDVFSTITCLGYSTSLSEGAPGLGPKPRARVLFNLGVQQCVFLFLVASLGLIGLMPLARILLLVVVFISVCATFQNVLLLLTILRGPHLFLPPVAVVVEGGVVLISITFALWIVPTIAVEDVKALKAFVFGLVGGLILYPAFIGTGPATNADKQTQPKVDYSDSAVVFCILVMLLYPENVAHIWLGFGTTLLLFSALFAVAKRATGTTRTARIAALSDIELGTEITKQRIAAEPDDKLAQLLCDEIRRRMFERTHFGERERRWKDRF
jgi:hypothetical protein